MCACGTPPGKLSVHVHRAYEVVAPTFACLFLAGGGGQEAPAYTRIWHELTRGLSGDERLVVHSRVVAGPGGSVGDRVWDVELCQPPALLQGEQSSRGAVVTRGSSSDAISRIWLTNGEDRCDVREEVSEPGGTQPCRMSCPPESIDSGGPTGEIVAFCNAGSGEIWT